MPNKSKQKGTRWEREIVKIAHEHEDKAERCWGSDGRSRGLPEEVDVGLDDEIHVQAKVRKTMAAWLIPSSDVDVTIVKMDRKDPLVIIRLQDWLVDLKAKNDLVSEVKLLREGE